MSRLSDSRFAFQGALGAFSHCAGQLFAGQLQCADLAAYVPCQNFEEVFKTVADGGTKYGVIPLENSSIGSIVANYDLLWTSQVVIIGEVAMPVHHQLLGLKGADCSKIAQVYSHPAALEQCRKFFARMPDASPIAHFDTSGAALYVSRKMDPTVAAIASELAGAEYGLDVLEKNIEDYPHNRTRFGIITQMDSGGRQANLLPDPPYKISFAVELPHQPGSLAKLLNRLAGLEVNLTKIESRPIVESPWHYRFFIDMQLDGQDQDSGALTVLKDSSDKYKLLGRYRPWIDGD